MIYSEFADIVAEKTKEVLKVLNTEVGLHMQSVDKLNGTTRIGLIFETPGKAASPTFYLDEYYRLYEKTGSITTVICHLLLMYEKAKTLNVIEHPEDLDDYSKVSGKIIYRLVNYEKNKEMLESAPHEKILDLALLFYVCQEVRYPEPGFTGFCITNDWMDTWGVDQKELKRRASENTKRIYEPVLGSFEEMRLGRTFERNKNLFGEAEKGRTAASFGDRELMYVLTNQTGFSGATVIAYPGCLKKISDFMEANLIILPSSVHETLIIPDNGEYHGEFLEAMVRDVNEMAVSESDYLSDHVYYYNREESGLSFYA